MEVAEIISPDYGIFKPNTVQDILNESEETSSSTSPRIHFFSNISELTDGLILTSASSVYPNILEMLNVKCIVNVAPELPDTPFVNDCVVYHKIPVMDSGSSRLLPYLDETADLIHKVCSQGGRVLVYCVAGVSRSATICLAYLMKHHRMTLLDAYNFVKQRRPRIKPNCGFFKQLIEYEKTLFDCNTVRMVFNEFVQMEIPDVYDCDYKYFTKRHRNNRT